LILVMMNFSRLMIVFGFAALAGCSTLTELRSDLSDKVFGREPPNPPAELEEISPTYNAKIDWSSNAGKTEKYDYTPALDSSAVYVANAEGEIAKLDAVNGRQLWRLDIGEPISGGIGIGAGVLLVGSNKGNVHAYDTAGKALWKAKVSSEILSVPRYFDGLVIVRTGDNHIFGLDAADGSRKWVYERISPALTLRSSVGLVIDGGAVYAGFAGGKMVAIRADNGKLLWEATVAQPKGVTEIERIADITSLPVVVGPIVYAVAYQGKIAAVDRRSGKVLWNRDISSYSGLNVEDTRIFVSHTLGAVYSLDYETGKTFWRQGALANRRLTAPLPMGNLIAVGDLEGYVHFLTRDEGKFAARIKLDSNPVMSLVSGSSTTQLIAETRDGGLYAISVAENGAKATSTPASTPLPALEVQREPAIQAEPVPAEAAQPESSAPNIEPSTERSIMFQKNDSILLPDVEQKPSQENSTPSIRLPSPEAQ
jgi:outer membrane protein assembly factor BamB